MQNEEVVFFWDTTLIPIHLLPSKKTETISAHESGKNTAITSKSK